jgi:N-acetylated-alpha-linked acidic dipeptidase
METLRMADADVLPYDYVAYAREITSYIDTAKHKAEDAGLSAINFQAAQAAAARFSSAAAKAHAVQAAPTENPVRLNQMLRKVESDLLSPEGLPNRPWYRHTIYAPGEYTGYAAVVIPGVNEAIDAKDAARAGQQLTVLTQALDRATQTLDAVH